MKVITATNKEIECNMLSVIENSTRMYASVEDISFVEAAILFSDKKETEKLTYGNSVYLGFTRLSSLQDQGTFAIVCLEKELVIDE